MNIGLSIIYSFILLLIGIYKKAFNPFGLIIAFIISTIICFCGNYCAFIALLTLLIVMITTDKIGKSQKQAITINKHNDSDKRNALQVLANLLISTILIIIYKVTNNNIYLNCFFISLAISAADTTASGIGILSKNSFNILTLKKAERGLSGNISILGLCSSLLAAMILGVINYLYIKSVVVFLFITVFGFIGSILDSILGCFQVKYICNKCKSITERTYHCDTNTKYYKGIKWFDNSAVNFVSNIIVCLIFLLIEFYL